MNVNEMVERLRYLDGMMTERTDSLFAEAADMLAELREKNERLQAEIDRLMLEHCPDEMTEKQVATWAEHQVAAREPRK
jgi:hypothetical protein